MGISPQSAPSITSPLVLHEEVAALIRVALLKHGGALFKALGVPLTSIALTAGVTAHAVLDLVARNPAATRKVACQLELDDNDYPHHRHELVTLTFPHQAADQVQMNAGAYLALLGAIEALRGDAVGTLRAELDDIADLARRLREPRLCDAERSAREANQSLEDNACPRCDGTGLCRRLGFCEDCGDPATFGVKDDGEGGDGILHEYCEIHRPLQEGETAPEEDLVITTVQVVSNDGKKMEQFQQNSTRELLALQRYQANHLPPERQFFFVDEADCTLTINLDALGTPVIRLTHDDRQVPRDMWGGLATIAERRWRRAEEVQADQLETHYHRIAMDAIWAKRKLVMRGFLPSTAPSSAADELERKGDGV